MGHTILRNMMKLDKQTLFKFGVSKEWVRQLRNKETEIHTLITDWMESQGKL